MPDSAYSFWDLAPERMSELLSQGVKVNAPDEFGDYLLTEACRRLEVETVRQLLGVGAAVNCQNAERNTPILCAIDVVHHNPVAAAEIVQMLANAGADLEIRGYMDKTPFLKACSRGDLPMVQLLVHLGANVKAVVDDRGILDGLDFADIFQAPAEMQAYVRKLCRSGA